MRYTASGAERVIFGTAAIARPGVVQTALERLPAEAVAVALDARDGRVAVAGWKEVTDRGRARAGGDASRAGACGASSTPTSAATARSWARTSRRSSAGPPHAARDHGRGRRVDALDLVRLARLEVAAGGRGDRGQGALRGALHARGGARGARGGWGRADARQAPDPVPRRRPRPRGEGRALRLAARRRRSRRGAPRATTPEAPTSSCSSTSRPPRTRGRSCSTWCGAWPRPSSCRSPWAAACAASRMPTRCCAPGPTRSRSTPRP